MNRLILSLALLGAGMFPAAAQHYRGFFDASFNIPVSNSSGLDFDSYAGSTFSGTTSHGVQLRNLFVGAGAGVMYACDSYGIGIPVFADVRYDFFNFSTVNLFIGCKVGYSFATEENDIDMSRASDEWLDSHGAAGIVTPIYDESGRHIGFTKTGIDNYGVYSEFQGLFIQPSIGVRFRLNATMGLNLTLSYMPLQMNCNSDIAHSTYHFKQDDYGNTYDEHINSSRIEDGFTDKFWSHRLAISVGLDF